MPDDWSLSDQARQQCETHRVDVDAMLDALDDAVPESQRTGRKRTELDGIRVLTSGSEVTSIRLVATAAEAAPQPQAAVLNTAHAMARMRERAIGPNDVAEALLAPRGRGGVHRGPRATVVVGTRRGHGQAVLTAWRSK